MRTRRKRARRGSWGVARRTMAAAVLGMAFGLAACEGGGGETGPGTDALEVRQNAFIEALGARDADRLPSLFADDAVLHVANMPPVEGREAIHGFYRNLFEFLRASEVTPGPMRVADGGGMAWSIGRTANEFRGGDEGVRYEGKYALVWEAIGGEWRIVFYGVSSDGEG